MVKEEELKALARNEEKLWDLAAMTVAPTLIGLYPTMQLSEIAEAAYDLADALMIERKRRFLENK